MAIVICMYSIEWSDFGVAHLGEVVLICPHLRHMAPMAGQSMAPMAGQSCCLLCPVPHLSHNCLSLWMRCIVVFSSIETVANDFICLVVASLALHISIAFWRVRSGFSNLLQV